MSLELNPVAFTSAPLLRAIAAGGWTKKADLARLAGRHPNNLPRDLTVLWEAGLISEVSSPTLTEHAEDQLAALDRAENPTDGLGTTLALHGDLIPDPDQPRKDFTSPEAADAIVELEESILRRGRILQPLAVRPHTQPGKFWITDGERRWRSVGWAIKRGDWPADRPLPITIQDTDTKETRLSQLTANMVRADMTPLEEADAFADLIDSHGMTTASIAAEIGMSQKLVQNRLRLRQLPPADRARMALPEDHPDHLGYKAALRSLMTPREADQGEPGSPVAEPGAPAEKTFDELITDKEALVIVELADRIDRHRALNVGDGNYCAITAMPVGGASSSLVVKGIVGFRQTGGYAFATVRLSSTPAGDWLRGLGFVDHRADVLFEARAKVLGVDKARALADADRYATDWLNVALPAEDEDGDDAYIRPRNVGLAIPPAPMSDAEFAAAESRLDRALDKLDAEGDQPELIEASDAEKAARAVIQLEAFNEQTARTMVRVFAHHTGDWMAFNRSQGSSDYMSDKAITPEALSTEIYRALAVGELTRAAAAMATLHARGSHVYRPTLTQMPVEVVTAAMTVARAPDTSEQATS